jgi:hypothetical protein
MKIFNATSIFLVLAALSACATKPAPRASSAPPSATEDPAPPASPNAEPSATASTSEPEAGPHGAFEKEFWPTNKHPSAQPVGLVVPQASVHDVRVESGDVPGATRLVVGSRFALRACYRRALESGLGGPGVMHLVLTIDSSGNVTAVQRSKRGSISGPLAACAGARMQVILFHVRGSGPGRSRRTSRSRTKTSRPSRVRLRRVDLAPIELGPRAPHPTKSVSDVLISP